MAKTTKNRVKVNAVAQKRTQKMSTATSKPNAKPATSSAGSSGSATKPPSTQPKANNATTASATSSKKKGNTNKSQNTYYPPSAFSFVVTIGTSGTPPKIDNQFKEVSGINQELEMEDVIEGGENRFVHKLPTRIKNQELVLKRGLVVANSQLTDWCKKVLEQQLYSTKDIQVDLMGFKDENKPLESLMHWSFVGAMPIKWEISDFNSMENELVVETITFSYQYFTVNA
ncbi:MAG: phage tail protein [Cytophagales bacterium]|nr:MAG: phage tail protein [Cytophagales bacterium]TAF62280.1 MAG: phage tail protein [Cytophagales bacterium]